MTDRRGFLAGMLAAGLAPVPGWADVGSPAYLAAAKCPDGSYVLCGLDRFGVLVFELPLPGRGHAAAAHPARPVAVAFARRPGTFALVIDCTTGGEAARLVAPQGHHFTGHGAYSADGEVLFTVENDYEANRGMVGVWSVREGYRRAGALPTHGVGPHEMRLMPDGKTLLVANGGIETHPDYGRAKLNIPTMAPNLTYLNTDGAWLETVEPPAAWHMLSTRHLAIRKDGLVAVAAQWQGDTDDSPPLMATHRRGEALTWHDTLRGIEPMMQGYAGSIAFDGTGDRIAITGPRGGMAVIFDSAGRYLERVPEPDICGVASAAEGFLFTTGHGKVLGGGGVHRGERYWDNHLVALSA